MRTRLSALRFEQPIQRTRIFTATPSGKWESVSDFGSSGLSLSVKQNESARAAAAKHSTVVAHSLRLQREATQSSVVYLQRLSLSLSSIVVIPDFVSTCFVIDAYYTFTLTHSQVIVATCTQNACAR